MLCYTTFMKPTSTTSPAYHAHDWISALLLVTVLGIYYLSTNSTSFGGLVIFYLAPITAVTCFAVFFSQLARLKKLNIHARLRKWEIVMIAGAACLLGGAVIAGDIVGSMMYGTPGFEGFLAGLYGAIHLTLIIGLTAFGNTVYFYAPQLRSILVPIGVIFYTIFWIATAIIAYLLYTTTVMFHNPSTE